jgi:uncharacterized protein
MKFRTLLVGVVVVLIALSFAPSLVQAQDLLKGFQALKRDDFATAISELSPLAEAGDSRAQFMLGLAHAGRRDYSKGVKWWRKAAEQGLAMAQTRLGMAHFIGGGVAQDYSESVKWWRKAAEQGDAEGQRRLGHAYYAGQGVPQDYSEGVKWWRKAAEQGDAEAQGKLSVVYTNDQAHGEAMKWARKAAEQGDAEGQGSLGLLHFGGQGIPQDLVRAYMWTSLSAAQGWEGAEGAAKDLSAITKVLTPAQIAEALKLARECLAQKYKGCD